MKKTLAAVIFLWCICLNVSAQQAALPDTNKMTKEDVGLILRVFDGNVVKDVIPRADMLIGTAKSPAQMAFLAEAVYDYYHDSKIMGYDEVAVYVADSYILNGRVKLEDGDKYMAIKLYADCNRSSLIGLPAPELSLPDIQGEKISVHECGGDYKLLLFYDEDCPVCRRQIPQLMGWLSTYTGKKLTFYRVYTQADREKWVNWMAQMQKNYTLSPRVKVVDVWDPDMSSDFVHKYGVISTPRMFLVSRYNTIIGRGLTPKAVQQVIDIYDQMPGKYDSVFNPVFRPLVRSADIDMTKITDAIDIFFNDSKDNPDFFHESMFSLFQYLKKQENYSLQKGAAYLAEKYIAGMPAMWEGVTFVDEGETEGSSLLADYSSVNDFIDATKESVRKFKLNPLEETAADLALNTPDGGKFNLLQTTSSYTVLYFYSTGCAACEASGADMKRMAEEYRDKDVTFVAVYTGKDKNWPSSLSEVTPHWKEVWDKKGKSGMFQKYDLDGLPRIYILDSAHKTIGKDLNPATAEQVLKALLPEPEEK